MSKDTALFRSQTKSETLGDIAELCLTKTGGGSWLCKMTTKASSIELCCSVCFGIFKDPVLMPCSHSFCTVCLQQGSGEKSPWECPVCKRATSVDKQPRNLNLKNIVESYIKQEPESESEEKNEACCSLHGEKLQFFCVEDQEPLCVMCKTSKDHMKHQLFPVEEATLDLKVFSLRYPLIEYTLF